MAAQTTTDYDRDNDGLIEVKNLEQLNAIRWDLDGDGAVDDTINQASYTAAFPDAAAGMGCPTNADDADDNDCIGYELSKSLDFNNNASYADTGNKTTWTMGNGWTPIADSDYFIATFDGNNRSITNLFINRPDADYQGLFGLFGGSAAEIRNVRLRDVNVTGRNSIGGLVGLNYGGTVSNSHATGDVTGTETTDPDTTETRGSKQIGGLVGWNYDGTVRDSSHETGTVTGHCEVGGLVGLNYYGGTISNSHATGDVTGTETTNPVTTGPPCESQSIGGLVGLNQTDGAPTVATVMASYATGTVTGHREVGGLVGWNTGTISTSHATSDVTGTETTFRSTGIGGLVGLNEGGISASHATGKVTGSERSGEYTGESTGGLVGSNQGGTIGASYATGTVRGENHIGGLVGWSSGIIRTSYATGSVTGQQKVGGLMGWNEGGTISASYARGRYRARLGVPAGWWGRTRVAPSGPATPPAPSWVRTMSAG